MEPNRNTGRIIGLIALLVAVAIVFGLIVWNMVGAKGQASGSASGTPVETVTVDGYLGGEKIGLFDDPAFAKLAAGKGLEVSYRKAGSLAMMDADRKGLDYLFPSSRTAVEYGKAQGIKPVRSDIVFNSPIVVYTHKAVADGLVSTGIMSRDSGGVYRLDMAKAVAAMEANKTWNDVGYAAGYGQFRIDSTDPVQSNSGNEYAALIATVMNGGSPATTESVARDGARVKAIFAKSGWMETSSEDSFNQFLTLGVGSKPMTVGYESQILDLAANQPDAFKQIKDDVVIVYPTPTVWSTHTLMALDENGEKLLSVLKSPAIQKLAWEQHGFRAANFTGTDSIKRFKVNGTLDQVPAVSELPGNKAMQELIEALKGVTPQPQ